MQDSSSVNAFINGYQYLVSIDENSRLFNSDGPFYAIANVKEFKIKSKQFAHSSECEAKLNNILSVLATVYKNTDGKQYVITKVINPTLKGSQPTDEQEWPKDLLLKAYITDVENLKDGKEIQYDISAEIFFTPIYVNQNTPSTH